MLELVLAYALLPVCFCFLRTVCIDGFLRKVVGPATCGDERRPAVADVALV